MTVLRPTPVSTRDLSYDAKTGTFTAEASSLPAPGRVYDDACDFGYTVISHLSGTKVVFVEDFQQRDRDDLLYTDYLPVAERGWVRPVLLRVFND
jgi:hypothetical protein